MALLRTARRGLQMVLRLLAHNAEHWLSNQLNAYLRDDDEYRAITRETTIRGTAGTISFTPEAIIVTLAQPRQTRVGRALALLIDEISTTPPQMPGDTRPITYQLTLLRIPIRPHGTAGSAVVAASGLPSIDDFAFTGTGDTLAGSDAQKHLHGNPCTIILA